MVFFASKQASHYLLDTIDFRFIDSTHEQCFCVSGAEKEEVRWEMRNGLRLPLDGKVSGNFVSVPTVGSPYFYHSGSSPMTLEERKKLLEKVEEKMKNCNSQVRVAVWSLSSYETRRTSFF